MIYGGGDSGVPGLSKNVREHNIMSYLLINRNGPITGLSNELQIYINSRSGPKVGLEALECSSLRLFGQLRGPLEIKADVCSRIM